MTGNLCALALLFTNLKTNGRRTSFVLTTISMRNWSKILLTGFTLIIAQGALAQNLTSETIIAHLSGHQPLADGRIITNRSSKENRALTREYLSGLIAQLGLKPQLQTYRMPNLNPMIDLLFNPFKGANVYGILPATADSDEYVILGAHFDTERLCPGALDNGSGITLAYSVVQQLVQLPHRNMNVILVFFDQEEEDLIGSQAFARFCKNQGFKIHSVHTFDTIGWDNDGDLAVELELPTQFLEQAYRQQANDLGIPIHTTRVNSTDHHSFRTLGFNAVGLTDEYANGDYPPYKDTPDDTYEKVNFKFLASCTQLVYQTVKEFVAP